MVEVVVGCLICWWLLVHAAVGCIGVLWLLAVVVGCSWERWLLVVLFSCGIGCRWLLAVVVACGKWYRLVGIWVGWLLLVHEVVIAVGTVYLWLLISGGCCFGCGWVCGSCGGRVDVVVTLGVTGWLTFVCDILSSSFSFLISFPSGLLLMGAFGGATFLTSRILSSMFTFWMLRW